MKQVRTLTPVVFSALLIGVLGSCTANPVVVTPTQSPTQSPVSSPHDTPPEDAVVSDELPKELLGYTFFGKPAAEYKVTEVSTRRFEKVRNLDRFPNEFASWEELYGEDYWGQGGDDCTGGRQYQPFGNAVFAVQQNEAACTGSIGGTDTPGVLVDGVFKEFIGYKAALNDADTHMVNPIGVTDELAIWTISHHHTEQLTEWLMFAGNLATRETTLLAKSSDPLPEGGNTPPDYAPHWTLVIDDRVFFIVSTERSPDDLIWREGPESSDGGGLVDVLFSVKVDGTDLRKDIDPVIDASDNEEALLLTADTTHYTAVAPNEAGAFEEAFSVKWQTDYMPHYADLIGTPRLQGSTLTISVGPNLVIARKGSDTLTVVRDAANPSNSEGNYYIPTQVVGDHVLWVHSRFDAYATEYTSTMGIYVLNLTTHKGLMTVVEDAEARPSEDGKYIELIRSADYVAGSSGELQRTFIPLP
ncbi:hypothetical protein ACFSYH_12700 [Populibacterium corticicola]|uniref:Uncharacterized protein n=1 Tax=Populibacterium corticicola TaxID=1812826 RepID=A0ABW5XH30_9MICO